MFIIKFVFTNDLLEIEFADVSTDQSAIFANMWAKSTMFESNLFTSPRLTKSNAWLDTSPTYRLEFHLVLPLSPLYDLLLSFHFHPSFSPLTYGDCFYGYLTSTYETWILCFWNVCGPSIEIVSSPCSLNACSCGPYPCGLDLCCDFYVWKTTGFKIYHRPDMILTQNWKPLGH